MPNQKIKELLPLAERGDAIAQAELSRIYRVGLQTPIDVKLATSWAQRSADAGNPYGQYNLAMLLENKNPAQSKKLFAAAAAQIDNSSMGSHPGWLSAVGFMYKWKYGGLPQDHAKATAYFNQAVALNDPVGQFNVANDLQNKNGPALEKEIIELYTKSAEQGYRLARESLGMFYYHAKKYDLAEQQFLLVKEVDPERAKEMLELIADFKNTPASSNKSSRPVKPDSNPSEVSFAETNTYWLSRSSMNHPLLPPSGVSRPGKWMIFCNSQEVDSKWKKIIEGLDANLLYSAKVSTKNSEKSNQHVIIVYTQDHEDIDDVIRVHTYLEQNGIKPPGKSICYKTDEQTRRGVYAGGKEKAWKYSSETICTRTTSSTEAEKPGANKRMKIV